MVLALALMTQACTSTNHREYAPYVRDLDDNNRLEVSTYPAGFPGRLNDKGAIIERYESADDVYYQVFIHDRRQKTGKHPPIHSVKIHSFSYRVGDEPPTVLLVDYEHNSWMQNDPRYGPRNLPPVPYEPDGAVFIAIDVSLNGKRYELEGRMPARESTFTLPTILAKQGV